MQPVNTESLLSLIFETMGKLDRGEINPNTACAQAKLASQAINVLMYEIKRSEMILRLWDNGYPISQRPDFRDIESKGFNNAKV